MFVVNIMNDIREFLLNKIKEKYIVDNLIKEYIKDKEYQELWELTKKYYLTNMIFQEYKQKEKKIKENNQLLLDSF